MKIHTFVRASTIAAMVSVLALSSSLIATDLDLPDRVRGTDYYDDLSPDPAKVELGQLLFYDKILGGNRNISCATCHHHLAWTGDGLALPVGEGGLGLGMARSTGSGDDLVPERVPRNAPHIFNVGAREFTKMFHDGRVEADPSSPSGFNTPAGDDLPLGLDNPLAAQAMFPVTSGTEMAGQMGENPIADAAAADNLAGPDGVWAQLADRLRVIEEYVTRFAEVFDDIDGADDITFVHAANAIAAFETQSGRTMNSPFDQYLSGLPGRLSPQQLAGMELFYGSARCSECHSGKFQTDQEFHSIALPQIGPGKGDGFDGHSDFGRERVTGDPADRYRFRTLSLRNVAATGPWGHDGAFDTLEAMIAHHTDPESSLANYDTTQAALPPDERLDDLDFIFMSDPDRVDTLLASHELPRIQLSPRQIENLIAFLQALTEPASLDMRADIPMTVPSGLPVAD